jgi:O-antigen/teichoic acid export membrane protein
MLKKIIHSKHTQAFIEQAGTSGFAVLSFIILARVLSKQDFGQWALYLTLITFIDMIKSGVVKTALIKYSSGSNKTQKEELIGSSWFLNISAVIFISLLCYTLYYLNIFKTEGVLFFLFFYPVYGIISMPFFYFLWNHQVLLEFKKITLIRMFNSLGFLIVCISSIYIVFDLQELIIMHIAVFTLSSLIALFYGNTGYSHLLKTKKSALIKILKFAKYHMFAFLGSNLLKSSDIFLIGAFLGPIAIAIYSIPLRLVELIEAPLKSAIAVAFPTLSAYDNNNNKIALKQTLEKYIGVITLLYIPFMGLLYIISEPLVLLIGGEKYIDAVIIFQLFLIYGVFLPFDRLTGITLDAIGLPKLNFYKVMIMASVNIIGDIVVIYFFNSIELVALVTVLNVLSGMIIGYVFLKREIDLNLKSILTYGFLTIVNYKKKEFNNQYN